MLRTTKNTRLNVERLDERSLPAIVGLSLNNGILTIAANNQSTSAHVFSYGNQIVVRDETMAASQPIWAFNAAAVGRVDFYGGYGNDRFVNDAPIPSVAVGNAGNDYLEGANCNDVYLGGAGNDMLVGYGGNDYLDGGAGNDYLVGGGGDDVFLGGAGFDWYRDSFNPYGWACNGYQPTDVYQQDAGTCSIDAAMAAAAGRVDINSSIQYLGNNQYQVRLFRNGSTDYQTVYFDGNWDDNDCRPTQVRAANGTSTNRLQGEFWTVLFQRAYLQQNGVNWTNPDSSQWGDHWCYIDRAVQALTGWTVNMYQLSMYESTSTAAYMRQRLQQNYVLNARDQSANGGHFYAIREVFNVNGYWYVRLYNPWGVDGVNNPNVSYYADGVNDGFITMSWGTFVSQFTHWSIA